EPPCLGVSELSRRLLSKTVARGRRDRMVDRIDSALSEDAGIEIGDRQPDVVDARWLAHGSPPTPAEPASAAKDVIKRGSAAGALIWAVSSNRRSDEQQRLVGPEAAALGRDARARLDGIADDRAVEQLQRGRVV